MRAVDGHQVAPVSPQEPGLVQLAVFNQCCPVEVPQPEFTGSRVAQMEHGSSARTSETLDVVGTNRREGGLCEAQPYSPVVAVDYLFQAQA